MTDSEHGLILDGSKILWHRDRIEAWRRGELIAPITIDMALTRACNWNCEYCFTKVQQHKAATRITRDVAYRFLDDSAEMGVKGISLVGDGESTCSPVFVDAIVRGHDNGIDMAAGTHGGNFDDQTLETVLPRLVYLRFNISAATPARYAEIAGVPEPAFDRVTATIRKAVEIKRRDGLAVTLGMQMVFRPQYADQILPLARLGRDLGVDYLVIKHCADDHDGTIGVDYDRYPESAALMREAEALTTDIYLVKAKWNKIRAGNVRTYSRCYGPPFMLQVSGSGLVAPCAIFFNDRYARYHLGNIVETPFVEIWRSDRYRAVMDTLAGPDFDARTMCVPLCLQELTNRTLNALLEADEGVAFPDGPAPAHVNFI